MNPLGCTFVEYRDWAMQLVGHHPSQHIVAYRRMVLDGRCVPADWPGWDDADRWSPGLRAKVQAAIDLPQPTVAAIQTCADGALTTRKLLLRLADGAQVETVCIPMAGGAHHTVCVSSQVGCKQGCAFCQTAKMGLVRQLSAAEIVTQVATVRRELATTPRNVVFMGMGEPLDNPEAVAQAAQVLTEVNGWGLRRRHITISTVGRADVLPRWEALGLTGISLAVSLFAADDGLRSELMPVNRVHPLAALKAALLTVPLKAGRRILVSVVVIPGINDGLPAIARLIAWCAGMPALVNLIPYNPVPDRPWRAPTVEEVEAMRTVLDQAKIPVRVRTTRGDSVMAACGQLGDEGQRRRGR